MTAPLRFRDHEPILDAEVEAWNTIRSATLAAAPTAQFAISLNAMHYRRTKPLRTMMSRLRKRLHPDGWVFDFYGKAAERRPEVMEGAVTAAHQHGETIGGNVFGIAGRPAIPAGSDYVVVQAFNFKIKLDAVRKLARRRPVFLQIGNRPGDPRSDGCRFIRGFGAAKRAKYIRKRARQQAEYGFRFAYPVVFPTCVRRNDGPSQTGGVVAYKAPDDPRVMRTIRQMLNRYEDT